MQYLDAISKTTEWSLFVSKANHSISQLSKSMPQPVMLKKLKLNGSMKTYILWRPTRPFRTNTPKDVLFIIGDWNAKAGSQETPGVKGKFGLRVQNEAAQRLIEFCQENALVIANTLFQQHKEKTLHMDITRWSTLKSDWLYSLQPKNGETLHSEKKQDQELTVAQIMNSLLQKSDWNWRKWRKPLDHSGMT